MKKIIEIIKKKWLRDTFLTILLILIIFAIYFLINFGVEKLNCEDIDLTANKIYSLSDSSSIKLKDIEKPIKIELINLSKNTYLIDFVNKYTQINSNITVDRIDDITVRPDIMNTYSIESTDSAILITSGEKKRIISMSELSTYDYTTYEEIDLTEETITNAIIEVTIENKPNIYFLEGHNNYDLNYFYTLQEDIKAESNEVASINILTAGSIPENCNCLVITTLKEDLTQMEKDKIIEYINNGGKILLLCDANISSKDKPNFNQILDLYGFKISNGVLFEQDENKMIYGSPEFIISTVNKDTAITKNMNMNMNICMIDAGKIEFSEDKLEELNVEYETIASTSDTAFLRTNYNITNYTKTNQDVDAGNSIIAALVTKTLDNGNKSELIVYSNAIFATNQQISINNYYTMYANKLCNNDDAIINSISYLTKRTDTITIRKNYDSVSYTVTESQHKIIMIVIFGIPILIIIFGIIVWQIRRRKK